MRYRSRHSLKREQGIVEALAGLNDRFMQQITAVMVYCAVQRAAKLFKLSEGTLPPLCSLFCHANRAPFPTVRRLADGLDTVALLGYAGTNMGIPQRLLHPVWYNWTCGKDGSRGMVACSYAAIQQKP